MTRRGLKKAPRASKDKATVRRRLPNGGFTVGGDIPWPSSETWALFRRKAHEVARRCWLHGQDPHDFCVLLNDGVTVEVRREVEE